MEARKKSKPCKFLRVKTMDFLKQIVAEIGGEYAKLASDIEENEVFVDTGSYMLNALVSGSIKGGVSGNKITAFFGLSGTGKTYFSLAVVKNYLDNNPDGYCLYFDTEAAVTKSLLESRGVDLKRVVVLNVVTIEEFRTKALKAVDLYLGSNKKDRKPCMFVLDSLGMMSTNKEIGDTLAEKETKDMTKAALIKATFRMLTLKLGQAEIPMIVTNHSYANIGGYGPSQIPSGGTGLTYASSTIIELSKSKEKDGADVVGAKIRAKTFKSRLSKENQDVEVLLFFDNRGLDRYYGLLQLGEKYGVIEKNGTRYVFEGKSYYEKNILQEPEKYFTEELLEKLDNAARMEFAYGNAK
jgi:RecA/RadA recombinase